MDFSDHPARRWVGEDQTFLNDTRLKVPISTKRVSRVADGIQTWRRRDNDCSDGCTGVVERDGAGGHVPVSPFLGESATFRLWPRRGGPGWIPAFWTSPGTATGYLSRVLIEPNCAPGTKLIPSTAAYRVGGIEGGRKQVTGEFR
ncbi:MAG: hypothetical protein ACODAD_05530 [Planctomycetota bacterium]